MPATSLTPRQSKFFVILVFVLPALLACAFLAILGRGSTIGTKQNAAASDISMLETALDTFFIDIGRYPTTPEGLNALITNPNLPNWKGPYIRKIPNDPWGNPYRYQLSKTASSSGTLSSNGPDGLPNTPDDITAH